MLLYLIGLINGMRVFILRLINKFPLIKNKANRQALNMWFALRSIICNPRQSISRSLDANRSPGARKILIESRLMDRNNSLRFGTQISRSALFGIRRAGISAADKTHTTLCAPVNWTDSLRQESGCAAPGWNLFARECRASAAAGRNSRRPAPQPFNPLAGENLSLR